MNILRVKKKSIELLERVDRDGAYLHLLLQQEAQTSQAAPEEYPLVVQLVRGVSEQRRVLEHALNQHLAKGLQSLPAHVQYVLLLGAYQLLFLDRVKRRDAVFEAVELVKVGQFKGFASLVNAVLRKIEPASEGDASTGINDGTYNFPEWLISRWTEQFGEAEVRAFCRAADAQLPLYLRVRTGVVSRDELVAELLREGVVVEPAPFSQVSLRVSKLPATVRLHELVSYQKGLFFVQDLSSTIVADIVSSSKPHTVRDLCAAPGGKACSIALSLNTANGQVLASDRAIERVTLIDELVGRLGLKNIVTQCFDLGRETPPMSARCDAVLLDAPCSGFGTVGRKVDARWSKSSENLRELVALQSQLLDRAVQFVKPGGVLVYSTCTIDKEENEQNSLAFLERHSDFVIESLHGELDPGLCTSEGFYRAWPQHHAMAGAFAARFRRRNS
jgi:16S rRNA (cytosine967-C5)-methyltransferase